MTGQRKAPAALTLTPVPNNSANRQAENEEEQSENTENILLLLLLRQTDACLAPLLCNELIDQTFH